MWLTQEELSALKLAATKKGTVLSPRMEEAIVPKLDEARNALGCPVPFAQEPTPKCGPSQWRDAAGCRIDPAPGDYS